MHLIKVNIIYLVLLLIGIKFSKDEKKIAGTIGIIVSILMILSILSLNIVDFLLGIFLLIHSIKYQKMFNKNSDEVIAYDYMDYTDEKNDDTIDYDDIDNYNNEKSNKKSLRINKKLLMIIVILIIVIPFVVFLVFDFYNTFKKTNNVRSISFVATAKEYVRLAQKEVSKTNNPNCNNTDLLVRKIPLSRIIGGTVSSVSPYGNSFDLEASYVEVEASNISGICSYIYSIYLTDGTYSIGGLNNPILESEIDIDKIKK